MKKYAATHDLKSFDLFVWIFGNWWKLINIIPCKRFLIPTHKLVFVFFSIVFYIWSIPKTPECVSFIYINPHIAACIQMPFALFFGELIKARTKKNQIEGTYVWNHIKKDFWLKSNVMKVFVFFIFVDGILKDRRFR